MIDIGVNLTSSQFSADRDDVVQRGKEAGVSAMILTGTDIESSTEAQALAALYPGYCFSTAGVHPHDAKTIDDLSLPQIRELAASPQVVAIGECGLDFNRDFSPRPQQEAVFEAQLSLAVELDMPVFLHCRDAHARFSDIFRKYQDKLAGAVLHCFTGDKDALTDCLDMGMSIGITGWVCDERRGADLQKLVAYIPADRLMIETDAPYLIPRDLKPKPKSRRNEPCHLPHIAARVAVCRGDDYEDLITVTTQNSRRFFNI
ncbi:3'-5' ssDNA/RNA exonuclease TatD [Veronia nyctiphanis]|uniref:3'-5' ssDNA/RNA exonuclease TatD n=1 Tax=Veronia nyctiphanis TaxID=1278244 RepID=A0A4Q0YPZ0_9GAMM|nr:3'-5' ssDNA/RNA exonuclease TatD [Veronia nyctiphanis]RXJ72615.1 3'-5' ssDNA/RNA exonuclease TatD [Veronia nyctiphanis]